MDPNETLRLLRAEIERSYEPDSTRLVTELESLEGVREYARALDQWLSNGGFLPSDWERES